MSIVRRVFGIASLCAGFGLLSLRPVQGAATAPSQLSIFTPDVVAAGEVVTVSVLDDQNRRVPDAQITLELNGVQVGGVVAERDAHGRHHVTIPGWVFGMGGLAFIASSGGSSARSVVPLTPPPSSPGVGAPPQINSCFPSQAVTSRPFAVSGDHLSGNADQITARFGNTAVPNDNILTASDHQVTVVPSKDTPEGRQPVTIEVNGIRSAPFDTNLIRPEIQIDKSVLQPGERTKGSLILHGAPSGTRIACDLSPSGANVTMTPSGRVETTTGRIDFQVTGVTPGHFDVRAVAGVQSQELPPDYPPPATAEDLIAIARRMNLDPATSETLYTPLADCRNAWSSHDGAKAAGALTDFQKRVSRSAGKGVTKGQAALLGFGAASLLQGLYASGMARPPQTETGAVQTITKEFRQTDLNNDGKPDPVMTFVFPDSLGGQSAKAHLKGTFSYQFDPKSGTLTLTTMDAVIDSTTLRIDLNHDGALETVETGDITLALTDTGFTPEDLAQAGAPNRGYFDPATGAGRVTWGVKATCALFDRMGIPSVQLLLPETGRYDASTQIFSMVGLGLVTHGPFMACSVANCCLWCNSCTVACSGCRNDGGVCSGDGSQSCTKGDCGGKCKGHSPVSCPSCGGRGCACKLGTCGC